jgi:hypothetical protein
VTLSLVIIRRMAESEGLTASLARFCGMQNYPAFFGVGISLDLAIALFSLSGTKLRPTMVGQGGCCWPRANSIKSRRSPTRPES